MFERIKLMNKDKFPKVVIGVCTYNRCLGLKRLLQSLIKLDYPNFEIIVVDNNSTDQTAKIISEFEKVKYIFEARQGLAYVNHVTDSWFSSSFIIPFSSLTCDI